MSAGRDWERYLGGLCDVPALGFRLDTGRMRLQEQALAELTQKFDGAFDAMQAIEDGAVANITEGRRVGHYWLRAPHLAPDPQIRRAIEDAAMQIEEFAARVLDGSIRPPAAAGAKFTDMLLVGIGGSALGPQFITDALGGADDPVRPHFIDNTDPEGVARILADLGSRLAQTLVIVTSKSGGTIETRNGMIELQHAFRQRDLSFPQQAVAVTGEGSALHRAAQEQRWLATFPMWDWVGGRTSQTSAVGLLPAALQGIDVRRFLEGAAACDEATRIRDLRGNPAAMLAAAWYVAGAGRGERMMIVVPYRDRLVLFGRYLQQLVMESLGKSHTRTGAPVAQGLTVFGNKGSTDQHAYIQQLRDGRDDFFVLFLHTLEDGCPPTVDVEPDTTSGDYLLGFMLGTRAALSEKGRRSMTLTLPRIDAFSLGALIALFERAVGLYAELIDVNAYDQPGVEAGKKAASEALALQRAALRLLRTRTDAAFSADEIARALGCPESVADLHLILERLAANPARSVSAEGEDSLVRRYRAG
ncbi:MAG: glucose-6-phosphate isomerase [Phycisphaerae bacterium]|nr:MAG: glucose-6-phosphate isomerase [Phycisphaerae bacterium]